MKRLLIIALALVIACGAMAQDTFGLWRMDADGNYQNYIAAEDVTTPFTLFITIHDPSSFSVGGYEVGMTLPEGMLILNAGGPNGWTNFGDATNQLVGFQTPVIVQAEIGVLGELSCLGLSVPTDPMNVVYMGANPPSIPGHDGPVYANGVNPDELIACGYVNGAPEVFLYGGVVGTEAHTLSDVKAMFE